VATLQPKTIRPAIQRLNTDSTVQFWSVLCVVLLGLVLRLYAAWDWNSYHPDSLQRLIGDEPGYDHIARELLQGLGFTWPGRVPLYPIWLAGIYLFTGGSYNAVPYVQSLLGIATIILTYALGYRAFGHTTGLIAAFFTAISYVLIHQSLHLLSEVLYTPAILLITIAFWDAVRNPSRGRFAWLAFWIGISNLILPTLFLFPLAMIAILVIALGRRQALHYWIICVLVSSLVIAPWMARNFIRYQALFPLATSNAILWQGSPEYYHLIHDHGYTYHKIWTQVLYKPGNEAIDPTSIAGDRFWTKRALRSIAAEPLIYLKFALEKAGTYWVGDPNADWGDTYVFNYDALLRIGFTPVDAVLYMIARLIPILALVAGIVLWRNWRRLLPIYALLGYCTLLHAATHAEARLSDPLQPLLFVLIAGLILATAASFRSSTYYRFALGQMANRIRALSKSNIAFLLIMASFCVYSGLFIYRTSFVILGERYFSLFDDGMISMRYARNLAAGYGLVWNPGGEKIEGFTNLLWVLYMALFHLLPVSQSKMSLFIQVSGALFLLCNLVFVKKIADVISCDSAMISLSAVLLTAFYLPINTWSLQGMEVSVLILIVSASVWMSIKCFKDRKISTWLYVLLGIGTLIRLDMFVISFAIISALIVADRTNSKKHLLYGFTICGTFIALQTLFRFWYFGEVLPNTYYLKMTGYPFLLRIIRGAIVFLDFVRAMNWVIFLTPFFVLIFRRDKSILFMLWAFLVQILYSIYVGGDAWEWWGGSNRYVCIVMPLFFILLCYTIYSIIEAIERSGKTLLNQRRVRFSFATIVCVCMLSLNSIHGVEALSQWLLLEPPLLVSDNQYSVEMAQLIDKITTNRAKVAVVYAGTIPYFLDRESMDLLGKNDKKIAHEDMRISDWKYTGFYPGHLKWDYGYTLGEHKPDIVAQLWDLWGSSKEATPYLRRDYTKVEIDGRILYVRNRSPYVRWDELYMLSASR